MADEAQRAAWRRRKQRQRSRDRARRLVAEALPEAEHLGLDKSTVSRRLRVAADGGYIRNLEDKRGKPGRWVVGDPLPEETDLLPQPCNLQPPESRANTSGCTVAGDFQGDKDGPYEPGADG